MMCQAQQEPQFTHNMFNHAGINPGYSGLSNLVVITGIHRQQYVGFGDGAPVTTNLTAEMPIKLLRGGAGISIVSDEIGYFNDISVKLSYAYHLTLGFGTLGIGPQISFINKSLDFAEFEPTDDGDVVISGQGEDSDMAVDVGIGGFYMHDLWYGGFSTTNILESSSDLNAAEVEQKRTYYLTGGYFDALPGNDIFDITPSVFLKTDFTSTQLDVNSLVKYRKKFWGGLTYRINDAVSIMAGASFKQIDVGYAYDITTSELGYKGKGKGSHEVMVRYSFTLKVDRLPQQYKNVRFL